MALISTGFSLKKGRTNDSMAQLKSSKSYSLNLEKTLNKKLDSAKRTNVSYKFTGGGFTAEFDAITFEMFRYACDMYFCDSSNTFDIIKDKATDANGCIVQTTYKIKENKNDGYTINLYLTKSSILVNGKLTANFISKDIKAIHEIMNNTNVNGIRINVKKMNHLLASQLQDIINNMNQNTKQADPAFVEEQTEKCLKCRRICRSGAVYCKNGHWVHYKCEKLSEAQILHLEDNKESTSTYSCQQCMITNSDQNCHFTLTNYPLQLDDELPHIHDIQHINSPTSAQQIMLEEQLTNCPSCDKSLDMSKISCTECNQQFHQRCIDSEMDICFACIGNNHQLASNANIAVSASSEPNIVSIHYSDEAQIPNTTAPMSTTRIHQDTVIPPKVISVNTSVDEHETSVKSINKEEQSHIKQRDLRQLELKLKKKEEQIKMKEAAINDEAKEKTRLLDRLHKAESRNLELELTIKTMNKRIELLENQSSNNGTINNNNSSTDDLILAVSDKVTRFVLRKVENELDKLDVTANHIDKDVRADNLDGLPTHTVLDESNDPNHCPRAQPVLKPVNAKGPPVFRNCLPPNLLSGRPMYLNAAPTGHFNAAPTGHFNAAPAGHFNAAPAGLFNAAPT
ncbi:RAG2 [Mytilus coruscus]|uniref:RAG2 n=1 Tax=Mytilus coruscus TaxID=42192 RepID=A0A6J8D558_MYTCO|nr:RAG2 [Mytilus coruscus]